MNILHRPKLVLLGMMTKMPVAGVVWQTMHYMVGFERLGFDVYYVEQHARTPSMFMEKESDDGSGKAAAFIAGTMRRFGFGDDRWCFHALHDDGRHFGLNPSQLSQLFREAALIINLHGGTEPLPEHSATNRLVYLETDPVALQIELHDQWQTTIDFLKPHCAFFTFGENYGNADCLLPVDNRFKFIPTRQPVVMDFWENQSPAPGKAFTTIGNWEQQWRTVKFKGETYYWSKHFEFLKVLDLPQRVDVPLELALSSYDDAVKRMLQEKGWQVRHALDLSNDADLYRAYVARSRGEFTVAKDQNVRLRSGWFSDRSATYLAAGRPVVTQETGFRNIFPTGEGLFGFTTLDDAATAIQTIQSDYTKHRKAATRVAREFFNYDVVLADLLDHCGFTVHRRLPAPATLEQKVVQQADEIIALRREMAELREQMDELTLATTRPEFRKRLAVRTKYKQSLVELHQAVADHVPTGSTVLFVSKGDDAMLAAPAVTAWHFPRSVSGDYAGYYPPDGLAALAQLEWQRHLGAQYLVLPDTAGWWLEKYAAFSHHLQDRCGLVHHEPGVCRIFTLSARRKSLADQLHDAQSLAGDTLSILDCGSGLAFDKLGDFNIGVASLDDGELPYIDQSFDIVAVPASTDLFEARRIARMAIIADGQLQWLADRDAEHDIDVCVSPGVVTLPGWIAPLVRVLRDRPDAGVVVPRVLRPDGMPADATEADFVTRITGDAFACFVRRRGGGETIYRQPESVVVAGDLVELIQIAPGVQAVAR